MGLLNSMFGGGTSLEISLDGGAIAAGGELTGTVTVRGGKKAAKISSLKVQVLGSRVGGGTDFEHRVLFDGSIAHDVALPAGEPVDFPLSVSIPDDADPSHDYQLTATADIPGVADPSSKVAFTVEGNGAAGEEEEVFNAEGINEVIQRWPALTGHDAEAFSAAIDEMREQLDTLDDYACIAVFARRFEDDNAGIRDSAIWGFAKILGTKADSSDIQPLLALTETDDAELQEKLVSAAGELGPAGEEILEALIRSEHPRIRRYVGFGLPKTGGPRQRELAELLRADSDPDVSSAGIRALGGRLLTDPAVVSELVGVATRADKEVFRTHALFALQDAPEHDAHTSAFPAFEANVTNESSWVRETVAETLPRWPGSESPAVMRLIEALATDRDSGVRCKLMNAFHANCPAHLRPIWERVAAVDADDEVRMFAEQALRD
ncbi:sporulation protein [Pyxidicoccus parkwayensis]|uniref:Sporulation protein n=1 Tax=Pyxidicoccus parkwayensis TaxID=2813578 RepID=A0ABX7NP26_9BACT|nr:HEAT repeat domain-containing protein [Pyxidicoccus parkwaysis]QSQ19156.1 sporulation protein [Pyxidicoccus parkwaysis]